MRTVLRTALNIDKVVGPVILAAIFVDVVLQALSRILPGNAIPWTVEVGQILLGALIWMGISVGVAEGVHVCFDSALKLFPSRFRAYLFAFAAAVFFAYMIILGKLTLDMMLNYLKMGSKTPVLGLNKFWIRLPMLLGCALSALRLVGKEYALINAIRRPDREE